MHNILIARRHCSWGTILGITNFRQSIFPLVSC